MAFSFTKVWSPGDTVTDVDLNGNFKDVSDILHGGIKNQHLSTAANIGADKIADRYTVVKTVYNLVPFSAAVISSLRGSMFSTQAGVVSSTEFWVPSPSEIRIARHEIVGQPGMEGQLMAITVYVTTTTNNGIPAKFPKIKVKLNDTVVGQAITLDDDDTFYRLHGNSPFSNPLLALSDKDVIDFALTSDGTGSSCRGVWGTIYERWSIGS